MRKPIGIFDSGIGGTSIWKEVRKILPQEDIIYLADSANAPYGAKSKKEIQQFCVKNTNFLLESNCKLIVVACNTATTNAIDLLRETYDVPFVGIEPAIKPAALQTQTKIIGVLATQGTLSSSLFNTTSKKFTQGIQVVEQVGKGLVELIEAGKHDSPEIRDLLKKYLEPMLQQNIDHLVLGCTHYPYLMPVLQELLPKHVTIIDSGEAVARQTRALLEKTGRLSESAGEGTTLFYTTGSREGLAHWVGAKGEIKSLKL
ncbi:MAG: glutamate racemase [Bacteroidota bacterium]